MGRALVEQAEAWARAEGCVEMAADTDSSYPLSPAAHAALGFATFDELPKDALTHTGYMQLSSDGEQLTLVGVVGAHKLEVNVFSADERTPTASTSRYS